MLSRVSEISSVGGVRYTVAYHEHNSNYSFASLTRYEFLNSYETSSPFILGPGTQEVSNERRAIRTDASW